MSTTTNNHPGWCTSDAGIDDGSDDWHKSADAETEHTTLYLSTGTHTGRPEIFVIDMATVGNVDRRGPRSSSPPDLTGNAAKEHTTPWTTTDTPSGATSPAASPTAETPTRSRPGCTTRLADRRRRRRLHRLPRLRRRPTARHRPRRGPHRLQILLNIHDSADNDGQLATTDAWLSVSDACAIASPLTRHIEMLKAAGRRGARLSVSELP